MGILTKTRNKAYLFKTEAYTEHAMADSFQSDDHITVRPYTSNVPYYFQATIASSSGRNDGGLPYNSSMHSFSVKVDRPDGSTGGCTGLVSYTSLNGNIMGIKLAYSTHISDGLYRLNFVATASLRQTTARLIQPLRFDRVYVESD